MARPRVALGLILVLALAASAAPQEAAPSAPALAQEEGSPAPEDSEAPEPLHTLRYHYANDTFTSTDYYFTQGMGFHYVSPLLLASPLVIPLPELGEESLREASLPSEWFADVKAFEYYCADVITCRL